METQAEYLIEETEDTLTDFLNTLAPLRLSPANVRRVRFIQRTSPQPSFNAALNNIIRAYFRQNHLDQHVQEEHT